MGDRWNFRYCREGETFDNFLGGRKAIIKGLTDDVEELCRQCDESEGTDFQQDNELPTIYEVVTNNDKNQEIATEKAKKRVTDKSTVSGHCKALSNSEVQGMSSSILVKDLEAEGKKAITKREPLMRSAMQTRSKALGIQTRAQTRKFQIKKIS